MYYNQLTIEPFLMKHHRNFIIQLSLCLVLTIVVILLLNTQPIYHTHQFLSWLSLFFFVGISIVAYIFGLRSAHSHNKNDFINLIIILIAAKMLICLFTVWLYQIFVEPESKLFVIPFFIIYLIFTSFEMYILTRLGNRGEI